MVDLRTDVQKERDKRADEVVKLFNHLKENSNGSMNAILNYISSTLTKKGKPITIMGVKGILRRKGLYNVE